MNVLQTALLVILVLALGLAGFTFASSWLIERRHPPAGVHADVNGTRLHYVHVPGPAAPDLPPLVFIHGASANLNDQMTPLRPVFEGRAELLFVDRPGHGWSERGGDGNDTPSGQAATIAALMAQLGLRPAIVVGHSFGGAVATALALDHPDRVAGLVLLSAATHPWPGGETSWYYSLAARPVIGRLFAGTLANPGGNLRIGAASECVFAPNPAPADYVKQASIPLVLRPRAFRANAVDVEGLFRHVAAAAPLYPRITVPTVVVTGDSDTVVYEEIHSVGLARDIPGAELVWVKNLGHKPDWVATDLVAAAVEKAAGRAVDLEAVARAVEARIAADNAGAQCHDGKPPIPAPTQG
jgi:pimeloyl-ACP methyl ester carboxylesterase